jgi:hypothetical protein
LIAPGVSRLVSHPFSNRHVWIEANYDFEHNLNTDGGSPANLRRQEYWTMLSGTTGQVYGSKQRIATAQPSA